MLQNTRVDHAYVKTSSGSTAGGLVGYVDTVSSVYINNSLVNCSEIYTENSPAGGLVGSTYSPIYLTNTSVRDCKIWTPNSKVGGLVGSASPRTTGASFTFMVNGCAVENCTVQSGSYGVGGLVGAAGSESKFTGVQSWVNYTWVNSTSSYKGSIIGYGSASESIAPQHTEVYSSTSGSSDISDLTDNTFDYTGTSPSKVIGSIIVRQNLQPGLDYGYGSVLKPGFYRVTVDTGLPHGSLSATPLKGTDGTPITVTAKNVDSGYHLNWTYYYKTGDESVKTEIVNGKFNLPAYNVIVSGDFLGNETTLVFDPSNGSSVTTSGTIRIGDNVVSFTTPTKAGHTFNGWNLTSPDGTHLTDKDGNLQPNVGSYTNETGYWKYDGDESITLCANWSKSVGPECELPTVSVNLSVGEISVVGDSYPAYVYINAPSDGLENWQLGSFKVAFNLTNDVDITDIAKGAAIPDVWINKTNQTAKIITASATSATLLDLTGKNVSIVNFTIKPSAATTGAEIQLIDLEINLHNETNTYNYTVSSGINHTLSATAPNSIIVNSSFDFNTKIEEKRNPTDAFIVLNEYAKQITIGYKVAYDVKSADNHIVSVTDDNTQYFIAVNGTESTGNNITAALSTTDNLLLDSAEHEVDLEKNQVLTGKPVSYIGPTTFVYDGNSVEAKVLANLSIQNQNAYAERSVGEVDGYARNFTTSDFTVRYYDASSVETTTPTVPGTYTFNITMNADVWDYAVQTIEDSSYTFTIGNYTLAGKWSTNNETFSAVNKSTGYMTYSYPDGMKREGIVLGDSDVQKFNFTNGNQGNKQELYLPLNLALTKTGTNLTALTDYFYNEPSLTFAANTHPASGNENPVPTVFYFTGYYLGDVNMDGAVNMEDPLFIAQRASSSAFNDGNRLYGAVYTVGGDPTIEDATAIAAYKAKLYDEHYKEIVN